MTIIEDKKHLFVYESNPITPKHFYKQLNSRPYIVRYSNNISSSDDLYYLGVNPFLYEKTPTVHNIKNSPVVLMPQALMRWPCGYVFARVYGQYPLESIKYKGQPFPSGTSVKIRQKYVHWVIDKLIMDAVVGSGLIRNKSSLIMAGGFYANNLHGSAVSAQGLATYFPEYYKMQEAEFNINESHPHIVVTRQLRTRRNEIYIPEWNLEQEIELEKKHNA